MLGERIIADVVAFEQVLLCIRWLLIGWRFNSTARIHLELAPRSVAAMKPPPLKPSIAP
jgi:hypothetical protein